jgi:hypothetical protein
LPPFFHIGIGKSPSVSPLIARPTQLTSRRRPGHSRLYRMFSPPF